MTLDIGGNRLRRVSDFRIASPMRVDRLGRNYAEVPDTIREFMRRGVVIRTVINNMTFDGATKDPMQQAVRDALIAFMAATAQAPSRGGQRGPAGRNSSRQGACGWTLQGQETVLLPPAV
jgi:hypothetical protein